MKILSASRPQGTKWYRISRQDLLGHMIDHDNPWVIEVLTSDKPLDDILDINSVGYGSFIEDDNLYYLVTDLEEININSELVDPEEAYEDYGFEALSQYIDNNPTDSVIGHITGDDINWNRQDIDGIAQRMLDVESFQDVVDYADELMIIRR